MQYTFLISLPEYPYKFTDDNDKADPEKFGNDLDLFCDLIRNGNLLGHQRILIKYFFFPFNNGLYRNVGFVLQRSFQYPVRRIKVSFRLCILGFQFKGVKRINNIDYPFLGDIGNYGAVMSCY